MRDSHILPLLIKISVTMRLTREVLRNAFIEALKERNLKIYFQKNDFYILTNGDDHSRIVTVKLILSTMINKEVLGSHNGNIVDGIGHFLFTFPKWEDKFNYYVFAFLNTAIREIEFVIVPDVVLRSRFQNQNRIPEGAKKAELTLWLMPDRKVYDCTDISFEGEWYILSKGVGGRMADGSELDFSSGLNNWSEYIDLISE